MYTYTRIGVRSGLGSIVVNLIYYQYMKPGAHFHKYRAMLIIAYIHILYVILWVNKYKYFCKKNKLLGLKEQLRLPWNNIWNFINDQVKVMMIQKSIFADINIADTQNPHSPVALCVHKLF